LILIYLLVFGVKCQPSTCASIATAAGVGIDWVEYCNTYLCNYLCA